MMMHFRGGGVGHKTTRHASETFKDDTNATHETSVTDGEIEGQLENEDLGGLQVDNAGSDNDSDGLEDEGYNESCESEEVTESESDVQSDSD
ncbi:MAG TPA: hypothetical protein VGO47_08055 [Chlamydiales bacterium]|nr:hypothetical protein [Chlamydiales bacterium]